MAVCTENSLADVRRLAGSFCRQIHKHHTAAQMASIIRRNIVETNTSICHSHDFSDANQLMLDAMVDVGIPNDFSSIDEPMVELITAAWNEAKKYHFDADGLEKS